MPVVSQAQNRHFRAHADEPGKLGAVARDFISASHGMKVGSLPQHVKAGKPARKPKLAPFSLAPAAAPTQAGHYDGDMPE